MRKESETPEKAPKEKKIDCASLFVLTETGRAERKFREGKTSFSVFLNPEFFLKSRLQRILLTRITTNK